MRRHLLPWLVVALCVACSSESKLPQAPGVFEGGGQSGGDRTVQDIDGTVGLAFDARTASDAPVERDGSGTDARPADAAPDTARDAGAQSCSLLAQDCSGSQRACYRNGMAGSACFPVGGVPAGGPCTLDEDCTRGFVCPESRLLCQQLCDPRQGCAAGAACIALPNQTNVGACEF